MKSAKKIVSIGSLLLALIIVFSLSSCSGSLKTTEIKFNDMFSNQEKTFYISKGLIKTPKTTNKDDYSAQVFSNAGFREISSAFAGNTEYRVSQYSDKVSLYEVIGGKETYCLIESSDNVYILSNPYVKTFGYKTDSVSNSSEKVSEYICFPFYLLEDPGEISLNHEFQLNKEYKITCSKEKMKEFYVNLDKFNVEDIEDGFLVNGFREIPKTAYRFDAMGNYKFTFSEKDNGTFLFVSEV